MQLFPTTYIYCDYDFIICTTISMEPSSNHQREGMVGHEVLIVACFEIKSFSLSYSFYRVQIQVIFSFVVSNYLFSFHDVHQLVPHLSGAFLLSALTDTVDTQKYLQACGTSAAVPENDCDFVLLDGSLYLTTFLWQSLLNTH